MAGRHREQHGDTGPAGGRAGPPKRSPGPNVRPAAVAGTFYPRDPEELRTQVRRLLAGVGHGGEAAGGGPAPEAMIVPHAGYVYSGPVAATAYTRVVEGRGRIERVVLVGPSHRVAFHGIVGSGADAFDSPLGPVPVDADAVGALAALGIRADPAAHRDEHALEVQLPFLLETVGPVPIVPLLTGAASPDQVAMALEAVWGPETLVVVSSDLSHHLDRDTARRRDGATAAAIEALDPDGIGAGDACGRVGIQGLLVAAGRRGLRARSLDLRNSGDTAGRRGDVVGYGAFVFERL